MRDGREFNFSYLKATDIVSLLRDEVSNYTDSPFNVRVETAEASFYRIPRVKFWTFVKEKRNCKTTYGIIIAINCLKVWNPSSTWWWMGKRRGLFPPTKAVQLVWGRAGWWCLDWFQYYQRRYCWFCGISTRNSVNRILNELKREGVLDIRQQKIVILDTESIEELIGRETF